MDEEFKYIAITNWDKYQSAKPGAMWIKDYVDKEADLGYSKLTALQRYIFDGLCRLRGRVGHNIDNDAAYIASALLVLPEERKYVSKAIRALQVTNTVCPSCGKAVRWLCDPCDGVVKWLCGGCETPVKTLCGLITLSNQRDEIQDKNRKEQTTTKKSVVSDKSSMERENINAESVAATSIPSESTPSPAPSFDIRDWDQDAFGILAHRLRNCIRYVLDYREDDYYRKNPLTPSSMEREKFVKKLDADTPTGWEPPKPKTKTVCATDCQECRRTGTRKVPNPDGNGFIGVPCDCPKKQQTLKAGKWEDL